MKRTALLCVIICALTACGCADSQKADTQAAETASTAEISAETEQTADMETNDSAETTAETTAADTSAETTYEDTADSVSDGQDQGDPEERGYLYEGRTSFPYPVTDEEHTHIGFDNVDGETEALIKEKLTNAKIISDLFRGRVPRADDIDIGNFSDFMYPVSLDFYSSDELREICADTFSPDAKDYGTAYSDSAPVEHSWQKDSDGDRTIHERLDLFIGANTINGYLCVSNDLNIFQRLHTVVAEAERSGDRIEAVICNEYRIEKETEDNTVMPQTVYTHSKMVMKNIEGKWYITTLEFPLGNELIFQ